MRSCRAKSPPQSAVGKSGRPGNIAMTPPGSESRGAKLLFPVS